jgi:hypothetical protein
MPLPSEVGAEARDLRRPSERRLFSVERKKHRLMSATTGFCVFAECALLVIHFTRDFSVSVCFED